MPLFMDYWYIVLVLPVLLVSMGIQFKLRSTYATYSKVSSRSGMTGAQMAEKILRDNGIANVRVESVAGNLTDHYSPKEGVIRLSEGVFHSTSVAALGIASHEAGHAVQHAVAYVPLQLRNVIVPVTNVGSSLSWPLILLGILVQWPPLVTTGILLFATVALFQFITLPVEFNASRRAMKSLEQGGVLVGEELTGARKVLGMAAMTYVAALAVSIANLLRLLLLTRNHRD